MNIFFLHRDPIVAAVRQHNKHVVKMTLESAQLLCTAHHVLGGSAPYKPTHVNHPCAVWVRSDANHYMWLYRHFAALSDEYTRRYGRVHKSWLVCSKPLKALPKGLKASEWSDPPQCMPPEFQGDDTVAAYCRYYAAKMENWNGTSRTNP